MGTIDNHQGFKLRFGEFPDLLFTAIDTRTYFDMTHFLQSMNLDPEEKIAEFTAGFALWIEHLAKMYGKISPGIYSGEQDVYKRQLLPRSRSAIFRNRCFLP